MMIGQHGNSLLKVILNESDTYICQLNQNATTPQIARFISVKLFKTKRGKVNKYKSQKSNKQPVVAFWKLYMHHSHSK